MSLDRKIDELFDKYGAYLMYPPNGRFKNDMSLLMSRLCSSTDLTEAEKNEKEIEMFLSRRPIFDSQTEFEIKSFIDRKKTFNNRLNELEERISTLENRGKTRKHKKERKLEIEKEEEEDTCDEVMDFISEIKETNIHINPKYNKWLDSLSRLTLSTVKQNINTLERYCKSNDIDLIDKSFTRDELLESVEKEKKKGKSMKHIMSPINSWLTFIGYEMVHSSEYGG